MSAAAALFVVTRRDLSPGAQAAQMLHAGFEFAVVQPTIWKEWYVVSNTVVLLTVADEAALVELFHKAIDRGFKLALFREPDLGNALTSIAFEPAAERLMKKLPLALES